METHLNRYHRLLSGFQLGNQRELRDTFKEGEIVIVRSQESHGFYVSKLDVRGGDFLWVREQYLSLEGPVNE